MSGCERRRRDLRRGAECSLPLARSPWPHATPTVTVTGKAGPIPGFPHTGNPLAAGAAVHAEIKISGSEYLGSPQLLIGVTVELPSGVKLDPRDFPSCPAAVILEEREPMC